jgi:hypothetical protein
MLPLPLAKEILPELSELIPDGGRTVDLDQMAIAKLRKADRASVDAPRCLTLPDDLRPPAQRRSSGLNFSAGKENPALLGAASLLFVDLIEQPDILEEGRLSDCGRY